MTTPFFASPEEIEEARRRIKSRGVLPTVARLGKAAVGSAMSALDRQTGNLLDLGADLLDPADRAPAEGPIADPRVALDRSALATGQRALATGARASSEEVRANADRLGQGVADLKESARETGALRTFGLPFTDAEITDVGIASGAGSFAGAAVPYVAAGALAPEVAVPGMLGRLGRFGAGLTRGATQSAVAAPLAAANARTPEGSTLGAIADLTGNESLQRLNQRPGARLLSEVLLDLGANVAGEALVAGRAAKRATVPDAPSPAAESIAAPSPAPSTPAAPDVAGQPRRLWDRAPKPTTPEGVSALKAIEEAALADPSPAAGRLQVTTFSDGTKVATRYRIVDRAEVAPSHDAFTWQPNPEATPGIQGRSYDADPGAQSAISRGGLEYDPDRALNPASSPEEGPPIVAAVTNAQGRRDVVAGNARVLMFDRASSQRPDRVGAYRAQLVARADEFGVDASVIEAMREPMLVRELVDPDGTLHTPESLAQLNNLSDRPATKVKSRGDDAATRAADLSNAPEALEHYAATFDPDATLAEYLRTANGREFFGRLVEGGVIAPEEIRGFANVSGELDDIGRGRLTDILRASVLGDPRIAERGGQAVRKLDSAIPSLALVKLSGPDWDLTPAISEAVELLQRARDAGMRSVDDLAGQGDLLGDALDPDVLGMARMLESTPAREIRDRVQRYATAAREAAQRQQGGATDMFPEMAASPAALRQELFGVGPGSAGDAGASSTGVPRMMTQAGETGDPSRSIVASSPPSGDLVTVNRSPSYSQDPTSDAIRASAPASSSVSSAMDLPPAVGDVPNVTPATNPRNVVPTLRSGAPNFKRITLEATPEGQARLVTRDRWVGEQGGDLSTSKATWEGPARTPAELEALAPKVQAALVDQATRWADELGLPAESVIDPGVKLGDSLANKIKKKGGAQFVGDASRASVVVDQPQHFAQLLDAVQRDGWLVQADDFNAKPTGFGYGALHLQLRDPTTGGMAELQLHTPQTWKARYTYGLHDLYDLYESKDPFSIRSKAAMAKFDRELAYAQRVYNEAAEAFLQGVPVAEEGGVLGVHFKKGDPLRGKWFVKEDGPAGTILADGLDTPQQAREALQQLRPVGVGDGVEELFGGLPRGALTTGLALAKGNKTGAIAGGAIGAATAEDDENPLIEGLKGAALGVAGQTSLRAGLRALERPDVRRPTKSKAPVPGAAKSPAERVAALEAEIPPPSDPPNPTAPSVLAEREELTVPGQRKRDRSARGYFNIPRLDLTPELQDAMANRVAALAPKAQGVPKEVVSNAETQKKAAKLLGLKTPDELAAIDWQRMSDVEGVALSSLVGERAREINDLVGKLSDPTIVGPERSKIEGEIVRLDAEANDLLLAVMKGASQQGRDLQANKILANLRSPEAALIRAQRYLGDRPLTPAEKAELTALVNAGDQAAIVEHIAKLRKSSLPEQLVVLRKAGLLTSLRNRVLDLTSNALSMFEQQGLSKPVQVATDFLLAKQTGQRTRFHGNRDLYRGNVSSGFRRGLADAFDAMGLNALTKGGIPRDGAQLRARVTAWTDKMREVKFTPQQLEKYGIPRVTTIDFLPGGKDSQGNVLLDAYMKASFQSASVADKIVKTAAYRGAIVDAAESLAYAEATPPARFRARVEELVNGPTDEMIAAATLEADRISFMNNEFGAKFANQVKALPARLLKNQAQKDAANAMMDFLFPFVKTGANIGARISDYAGLAGVRAVIGYSALRKALAEGADASTIRQLQREVTTLMGRATTGAAAMYGVGLWAYQRGLITGAFPSGSERSQWELEGKTANSVLIGDQWQPLARLTPLGAVMAAGANLGKALENQDLSPSERAFATATATTRTALDQPLVTGTKTLLDAVQDTERFGEQLLRSSASSLVPTVVADVGKALDDGTRRRPKGAAESIKERIPGLRETIPARIDALGREVKFREGAVNIFLNPFSGQKDRSDDPVVTMLRETGARVATPRQEKEESGEAFERRSRLEGELIYEALTDLRSSGALEGLDPDEQVRVIDDEVRAIRREIRDELRDLGLLKRSEGT